MNEDTAREIAIQILDECKDLLAPKGIKVPSEDREGREEEACLYGREYYELEDTVVGGFCWRGWQAGVRQVVLRESRWGVQRPPRAP